MEGLLALVQEPLAQQQREGAAGDAASPSGDGQSPLKIALFSLGNLSAHLECRERLLGALSDSADARRDSACSSPLASLTGAPCAGRRSSTFALCAALGVRDLLGSLLDHSDPAIAKYAARIDTKLKASGA